MPITMKGIAVLFDVGRIFATLAALNAVNHDDMFDAFTRHISGDWGDLDEYDWKANDDALEHLSRILSSYNDRNNVKFWIITEADRSSTTVMLPSDY